MKKRHALAGFTMVEMLMAILLVAIITTASIGVFNESLDDAKFDATYKEMLQIRKAIIGDLENTTIEGERIRFGYLGDMGGIPTNSQGLSAVYQVPVSTEVWSIASEANLGVGWNGPYLVSSTDVDFARDAWGRDYIYNADAAIPYVLSLGSDGALGGEGHAQDIQVDLPVNLRIATVSGQITSSGSVYRSTADVTIYYPDATGALTSQALSLDAADEGAFTFNNIPFGIRSIKVDIPNSTIPQMTLGPQTFTVDNQNYFIQSSFLDANPNNYNDTNCNTVTNVTYVPGTFYSDDTYDKVSFKINVDRSFSINSFYAYTNGGTNGNRLEKIGINGIFYGCIGILTWVYNKPTVDRTFQGCNVLTGRRTLAFDTDADPNVTFNTAWGIASGQNIEVIMDFQSTDTITSMDMLLGCDRLTIQ